VLRALTIQTVLMAALPISLALPYGPGLVLRAGTLLAYPLLCWLAGCFEEWETRSILQALREPRRVLRWFEGLAQ
jgi:hypothetical protein